MSDAGIAAHEAGEPGEEPWEQLRSVPADQRRNGPAGGRPNGGGDPGVGRTAEKKRLKAPLAQ
jgi:hypothetical protein